MAALANYYWIAINGSSCALNPVPLHWPFVVKPTPEILIGFPNLDEACEAQEICLNSPIGKVAKKFAEWKRRDDVSHIKNENSDPQTSGITTWEQR